MSICRYPARSAALTARSVSAGGTWKTPSPTAGIELTVIERDYVFFEGAGHDTESARRTGPASWSQTRTDCAGPVACRSAVTNVGVKVIPWIPTPAKRVMFGGRAVIIDGNTLDPTLQLMLSGLRLGGIDGLVVDDDPAASRAQMRESLLAFPGPQIHVTVDDLIATRTGRRDRGAALPPGQWRGHGLAGLLPRRWLGDRRPGHRRRAVPADLP